MKITTLFAGLFISFALIAQKPILNYPTDSAFWDGGKIAGFTDGYPINIGLNGDTILGEHNWGKSDYS